MFVYSRTIACKISVKCSQAARKRFNSHFADVRVLSNGFFSSFLNEKEMDEFFRVGNYVVS